MPTLPQDRASKPAQRNISYIDILSASAFVTAGSRSFPRDVGRAVSQGRRYLAIGGHLDLWLGGVVGHGMVTRRVFV
jgi:hypothetical protein